MNKTAPFSAVLLLVFLLGTCVALRAEAQGRTAPRKRFSKSRACKTDGDCTLLWKRAPNDCRCGPCGVDWRDSVNRKHYRRLKRRWAKMRRCQQTRRCPRCRSITLGLLSRCISRQCTTVHPEILPFKSFADARVGHVYSMVMKSFKGGWRPEKLPEMAKNESARIDWLNFKSFPLGSTSKRDTGRRVVTFLFKSRKVTKLPKGRRLASYRFQILQVQ